MHAHTETHTYFCKYTNILLFVNKIYVSLETKHEGKFLSTLQLKDGVYVSCV
jgi:hypothetical protein